MNLEQIHRQRARIHLRDIVLPDVEIHHDLESIVASVTHVREEKVAVVAPVEGEVVAGAEGAAPPAAAAGVFLWSAIGPGTGRALVWSSP